MTRRISLIIGVAVIALAFGVPTAFGEGRLAGSPEADGVAFFYANERATLAQQSIPTAVSRPDSHDIVPTSVNGYIDAAERAQRISPPVSIESANSGSDLDWSQLGIGFCLGLVLAFGLFLAVRVTRVRRLAH